MAILKNAWKNTVPCCAKHGEEYPVMTLTADKKLYIYKCPVCGASFSINDFEKILDNIAVLDENRFTEKSLETIEDKTFKISTRLKCKIIKEDEDFNHWKVSVDVIQR